MVTHSNSECRINDCDRARLKLHLVAENLVAHDLCEEVDAEKVRDRHEEEHGIREVDDSIHRHGRAENNRENPYDLEAALHEGRPPEEELGGKVAVVVVAQDRREREERHRHGQNIREPACDRPKCIRRHDDAVAATVLIHTRHGNGDRRERADDNRVHERLPHRGEAFRRGLLGLRGRVRHAGRAHTRSVREERALDTNDGHADRATGHALAGYSRREDLGDRLGHRLNIHDDDREHAQEVHDCHERRDARRPRTDRLNTADDHERRKRRHNRTDDPAVVLKEGNAELIAKDRRALIRLEEVTRTKHADERECRVEEREDDAELLEADVSKTVPEVIHGAAMRVAVIVNLAVLRTESRLGHLYAHREEAEEYDPQRGTGTTDRNGDGDTGDIAEANGPRKLRCESLERAHLTRVGLTGVFAANDTNRVRETRDGLESKPHREEEGGRDQPQHDDGNLNPGNGGGEKHDRRQEIGKRCKVSI